MLFVHNRAHVSAIAILLVATGTREFHRLAIRVEHTFRGEVYFVIEENATCVVPLSVVVGSGYSKGTVNLTYGASEKEGEIRVTLQAIIKGHDFSLEVRFDTRTAIESRGTTVTRCTVAVRDIKNWRFSAVLLVTTGTRGFNTSNSRVMIPHRRVALPAGRIGYRVSTAVERSQSQGGLPGFGMAFLAIHGE
jgi:hypothetical protein